MKQCPTCKTTYTDETLRYCLADGSPLTDLGGEQETFVRPGVSSTAEKTVAMQPGGAQMRVEIPTQTVQPPPTTYQPVAQNTASGGSSSIFKILLVVLGLGFLALLAAGLIGFFVYYNVPGTPEVAANNSKNAKAPSPSPTTNETDELRDQIANLEKRLNEQKKNEQSANTPLTMPKQSTTTTTARVNSPGDGFLALRTLPSSDIGDRIAKIPHGAAVSIGACGPVIRPGNKSGRWCQASYNGYSGWVFDAYLIY